MQWQCNSVHMQLLDEWGNVIWVKQHIWPQDYVHLYYNFCFVKHIWIIFIPSKSMLTQSFKQVVSSGIITLLLSGNMIDSILHESSIPEDTKILDDSIENAGEFFQLCISWNCLILTYMTIAFHAVAFWNVRGSNWCSIIILGRRKW